MKEAETARRDSSRVRSLEILGRHLGMFVDRLDVTSTAHFETSIPPELTVAQRENVISLARILGGKQPPDEPPPPPTPTPVDDDPGPDQLGEDQPLSVFAAAVRR